MTSALAILRRAANALARLEDAIIFNGQAVDAKAATERPIPSRASTGFRRSGKYWAGRHRRPLGSRPARGSAPAATRREVPIALDGEESGQHLVAGRVTSNWRFGSERTFRAFRRGTRSEILLGCTDAGSGFARAAARSDHSVPWRRPACSVRARFQTTRALSSALGGAPVELVVATDVTLQFLQVTADPSFVFRVMEKMVLRIKESDAIVRLAGSRPEAQSSRSVATASTPEPER